MDASSDYYESDNFKRNNHDHLDDEASNENLKNFDYIRELIKERNQLDSESHASRLLDQGIWAQSGENFAETFLTIIDFTVHCFLVASFSENRNPKCKSQWKTISRQPICWRLSWKADTGSRESHCACQGAPKVQFRGKATWSAWKFYETAARRDSLQDGNSWTRLNERQKASELIENRCQNEAAQFKSIILGRGTKTSCWS